MANGHASHAQFLTLLRSLSYLGIPFAARRSAISVVPPERSRTREFLRKLFVCPFFFLDVHDTSPHHAICKMAIVWDTHSAVRQCTLVGHEDAIVSVDFSTGILQHD